jgi:hypothetical protein
MSKVRLRSGMDLVKRMKSGSDLQDMWIMFDHVKRVKHWMLAISMTLFIVAS